MRSLNLTEQLDGLNNSPVIIHEYDWEGHAIPVCDSMANMLLVIELFGDEELDPEDKWALLPRMLFGDDAARVLSIGGERVDELLASVLWDACGLDIIGDKPHEKAVFDWGEDAARISASVMAEYHMTFADFAASYTFAGGCELLGMLAESDNETPFRQALAYRMGKPPKRTKHNAEYVDAWLATRRHFALKGDHGESAIDRAEEQNNKSRDFFAALKAKAEVGNARR